jgi:tetratricopeptide (TPR) repeat protein
MAFVGREEELELLQRELALSLTLPAGRSVFVRGPAGTGKTSLVAEFLSRIQREQPGVTIARGRCLQTFGAADPYLPFVDALQALAEQSSAAPTRKENLGELVAELAPYWLSVIPMVGGLLSAGYATASRFRAAPAAGTAPSREALFVQYLDLIRRLAQQSPLVLFLDDLHWADHASVALLSHLSRGVATLPVFILGTLRSDDAETDRHPMADLVRELEREGLGRALPLGDMDGGALDRLLAVEFGGDLDEPLRRWIVQTAGGNPLFTSELCRLLKQSGAAREVKGEWRLTPAVQQLEVPRSAEAVIETRIDRLDPDGIKLMQYASVEGNDFSSGVLSALLERDELEVLDALDRIERVDRLIRSTGETELPNGDVASTFQFRHALVQTVLYRQVVGKRRVLLHRKAGEIIESLFAGAVDGVAGKLARHFHRGRVKESAHRYACLAGESAWKVYAHWEAEELLQIALEHAPDRAGAATVQERLGDVYHRVGEYVQGSEYFRLALDAPALDQPSSVRLQRKLTALERKAGLAPVPALLRRLRGLAADAVSIPDERCRLLLEIAYLPGAVAVVDAAREAVAIAESLGDRGLLAEALEQLGFVLIFSGAPEGAITYLERAHDLAGAEDPLRAARYYNIRGIAHAKLGQYRQALSSFERMLAMSQRFGDAHFISAALNNTGAQLLILGEYDRAEQVLQRARVFHERRDRAMLVQSLLNLAKRAHWAGDLPVALDRYREMLERAREFEYWNAEAVAIAGVGLCHLDRGDLARALDAAREAGSVVADRDDWFEDREFLEMLLARLEARQGLAAEAAHRLGRAASVLREADLFAWAQVECARVRVLRDAHPDRARDVLRELRSATRGLEFGLQTELVELERSIDAPLVASPAR